MKKYIATIENLSNSESFEIYFDSETCTLISGEEEVYDMSGEETTDKAIVETVFGMYNGCGWNIVDCIEYEY